jgi:hypothetical protein
VEWGSGLEVREDWAMDEGIVFDKMQLRKEWWKKKKKKRERERGDVSLIALIPCKIL